MTAPQICPCSKRHSPPVTLAECDWHHSPPRSFPLRAGATHQRVRLCAQAHRLEHSILNLFVANDGEPPKAALRRFPPVLIELARQAWADSDHTSTLPRTIA